MSTECHNPILRYPSELSSIREEFVTALAQADEPLSGRDWTVLQAYWGLDGSEPRNLAAIGRDLGITRERTRQIRDRAQTKLREALLGHQPPSAKLLVALVASRGGIAELETLVTTFQTLSGWAYQAASAYVAFLLESNALSGVAMVRPNLVADASVPEEIIQEVQDTLKQQIDSSNGAYLDDLVASVAAILPLESTNLDAVVRRWAAQMGREVLPGLYAGRRWTRRDYARFVLEQNGAPLHFSAIAQKVAELKGETVSITGMNTLLNDCQLFVRVGAGDFALTEWGPGRYDRFDQVIERYLASGRVAEHVDTICTTLRKQYTVSVTTIHAMLATGKATFIHYGGGFWGLRGYAPIVQEELVRAVTTALRMAMRPLNIDEALVSIAQHAGSHYFPQAEVLRALFVCPQVLRRGSTKQRRFTLKM
jgi:hypothetical protein